MRRRKGVSFGTVAMLAITAAVITGCVALFPKLTGNKDVRVNAAQIAVALDNSLRTGLLSQSAVTTAPKGQTPSPSATPKVDSSKYSEAAPVATVKAYTRTSFSLTAAGTLSFSASVQKSAKSESEYDFEPLLGALASADMGDIAIATLENTVIEGDKLTDVNMPKTALSAIRACGINTLCLGFPSILNGGVSGLERTIAAVKSADISPYGVYPSAEERASVTMLQAGGATVALLNYQSELSSTSKKRTTSQEQETAIARPTIKSIEEDIQRAKDAGAQVIIVSVCWGKENATAPTKTQTELAQGIADVGADIILGTHPDAVQTVEILESTRKDGSRHKTVCAYSLGTLLTSDREKRARLAGMLLHMTVNYDPATDTVTFENLGYTPTYIWRGRANGLAFLRVVQSGMPPPEGMDKDQQSVMERCRKLIEDVMAGSQVAVRE